MQVDRYAAMKATLQLLFGAAALAAAVLPPLSASAAEHDSESHFFSDSNARTVDQSETLTSPESSLATVVSEAVDAEPASPPQEEKEEVIESEDYDAAVKRSSKRVSAVSATRLAKQQLSPEEYADAEKEVLEELEVLNRYHKTTTTTKAPGFFKEVRVILIRPLRYM